MARTYVPERGDLVWLQFSPQAGHEQSGMRPALVVSSTAYNEKTGLAVFCWIAVQPAGRWARGWAVAAGASGLAYAIACYGVPPSSLATVVGNVGPMHTGFWFALHKTPLLLPGALIAAAALGYLLRYSRLPLFARFGFLYCGLLAAMVLTAPWGVIRSMVCLPESATKMFPAPSTARPRAPSNTALEPGTPATVDTMTDCAGGVKVGEVELPPPPPPQPMGRMKAPRTTEATPSMFPRLSMEITLGRNH